MNNQQNSKQGVGVSVQTDEQRRRADNNVQKLREAMLMSKAELARKAGLSALTIDRVERGNPCRMDTKRKILLALGLQISERKKVFMDPPEEGS